MRKKKMEAALYCLSCMNETVHEVTYIDDILYEVRCETCGKTDARTSGIEKELYLNYLHRIMSKPKRVKEEVEGSIPHFLKSLPYRVLSKPFRTYSEFKDLWNFCRKKSDG
ncbi:hypothetical protein A6764_15670 [Brevibacillus sp. WF146]|uniref:hypothetical protein n=1 Tax=Brevibacillus sp. WF146 TaxID=319501 RepID=UPI0007ED1ABF|nr:hypothetical protein [Brevibacillus sp. WF146]UYZ12251.1 hypothetical protein A6764_15670 [Brevibacillus sp. WF146]